MLAMLILDFLYPMLGQRECNKARKTAAPYHGWSQIMQRLLAPDGCPWDREQTLETLRAT